MHQLRDEAARPGASAQEASNKRPLSQAPCLILMWAYVHRPSCRGNFLLYRAIGGMLAWVSSRGFRAGLAVSTDEAIEYLKPLPSCLFAVLEFEGPSVRNRCEPHGGVGCLACSGVSCNYILLLYYYTLLTL
jgi:hypothetical protein